MTNESGKGLSSWMESETNYVQSEVNPYENVLDEDVIMPILVKESSDKKLEVFLFPNEEVKKYWNMIPEGVGIALLAKNEDNALNNLRNLRKCYLVRLNKKE